MTNLSSTKRMKERMPAGHASKDQPPSNRVRVAISPSSSPPANDNLYHHDFPACLAVTDDELRLLRCYLGQQILALFG